MPLDNLLGLSPYSAGPGIGSPDAYLPGTGTSRQGGVESVFEFNSLAMNVRSWIDTYIVKTASGLDGPDVRDAREVNPGYDGETPFDAHLGGRTIVLGGFMRAFRLDKLRDMKDALLGAVYGSLPRELPLVIRSGSIEKDSVIFCKIAQKPDIPEEQNNYELTRPFQIYLRASDGRRWSYVRELRQKYLTDASPLIVPNYGNYVSDAEIHLTGPQTNPLVTVSHASTMYSAQINTTIPNGETWVLNGLEHSLYRLSDSANRMEFLSDTADDLHLHPFSPENLINVTASGTTAASAIAVYWRHATL